MEKQIVSGTGIPTTIIAVDNGNGNTKTEHIVFKSGMETYEQEPVDGSVLGDNFKFVKENMECTIYSYKGKVFNVEPPFFVELEVTETDPGFAGNTATNATKPATVETGAEIKVPLFIERGERIKIDTRTGEYLSRA